jgi:hypothetical protein
LKRRVYQIGTDFFLGLDAPSRYQDLMQKFYPVTASCVVNYEIELRSLDEFSDSCLWGITPLDGVSAFRDDNPYAAFLAQDGSRILIAPADFAEPHCLLRKDAQIQVFRKSIADDDPMLIMRIARELHFEKWLCDYGSLECHASCVSKNGQGLIIMGPKGAGKTSLALSILQGTGVSLVSNDSTLLHSRNDQLVAEGVALKVRCGRGMLKAFPSLQEEAQKPSHKEKVGIAPIQLGHALDFTCLSSTAPKAILLPRISTEFDDEMRLDSVPYEAALAILEQECNVNRWPHRWLSGVRELPARRISPHDVVREIPCFRFHYGYAHVGTRAPLEFLEIQGII